MMFKILRFIINKFPLPVIKIIKYFYCNYVNFFFKNLKKKNNFCELNENNQKKQYVYRGNQKFFIKDLVQDISNKNINKWIKECEKLSSPGLIADTIKISKKMAAYTLLANISEEIIPKIKNNYKISKYLLGVEKIHRILARDLKDWPHSHRFLARNLWFQGRISEAFESFKKAEEISEVYKKKFFNYSRNTVFLPRNCSEIIGLMGHLDSFVKHKILNKDKREYILFVDDKKIINKCYLDYFKKYIKIIPTHSIKDKKIFNVEHLISEDWNWIFKDRNLIEYTHKFMAKTQVNWEHKKKAPIMKLNKKHKNILNSYLNSLGYKDKDWHICVHVRSEDFYNEKNNTAQSFRNSPIEDYYLLFKKITDLGGWVFRMGDSSMPKVDKSYFKNNANKIIDYANSKFKNDVLDVAICATCKLFVSSPSGLHTVAHSFGKPSCYVNFPIYAGFPWHSDEILLPKKYINSKNNKMLTIDEIYKTEIPFFNHGFMFDTKNIILINNEPHEILNTVLEALQKYDKKLKINLILNKNEKQKVKFIHSKINKIDKKFNLHISGKLAANFCLRYFNELK